jgi:hypothetical protein
MAEITRDDITAMLMRFSLFYRDQDVNEATIPVLAEDYFEDLRGIDASTFQRAISEARKTCRFFPKSVDILEAVKRVTPTYREFPPLPAGDDDDARRREIGKAWIAKIKTALSGWQSPPQRSN